MPVVCLGVNFRTAPVALRERLAVSPTHYRELLGSAALRDVGAAAGLHEFALLSTCNRTELYAAAGDVTRHVRVVPDGLSAALAAARGVPADLVMPHLYTRTGKDAVRHLCRVASGLDSMVLGESEILGQVVQAYEAARQEGDAGRVLSAVFHTAIRAGRRARTETGICRCPMNVSSEAVRMLRETGWTPASSRVLLVGTGRMARLAGEVMRAQGVGDLRVIGRTAAHAEAVARGLGASPLAWPALESALTDADVVFCATSAPHAVVTAERVRRARAGRPGAQPLRFVDIAVPRDVEPEVRALAGVSVLDLDDLHHRLAHNLDGRRREIPAVEALIEEEVLAFEDWRHGAELRPLLAAMHQRSEAIRQREVSRVLRRLKDCPPEVERQVHAFSRSLVAKLLHEPTRCLRAETDPERSDMYARVARDFFGLRAELADPAPVDGAAAGASPQAEPAA